MNTSVNNDDASIVGRELNGECVDREPESPQSESIANWQLQEQPRYRLLHEGAEALANAELLALCLGSGVAGEDAVAMARRLLKHFGGIGALLSAPMPELLQCHGVGSAKASVIKAIQELSLRDVEHELAHADQFADSVSVSRFLAGVWVMNHARHLRVCFSTRVINLFPLKCCFAVLWIVPMCMRERCCGGVLKSMLSLWCWPIITPRAPLNPVRRTSSLLGALRNFYSR